MTTSVGSTMPGKRSVETGQSVPTEFSPTEILTLRDLVVDRERRFGDVEAFVFEHANGERTQWTYGDFAREVRHAAAGFSDLGVRPGDAVLLHLSNRPEFVACWFGLAWIGAVMVPSNTANTERELLHLVDHAEVVGYVTSPAHLDLFAAVSAMSDREMFGIVTGDSTSPSNDTPPGLIVYGQFADNAGQPPEVPVSETDVCELLFTSGTTSAPKAVMITHANLVRAGMRKVMSCEFGPTDRFITALPAFHANAQTTAVMAALMSAGTCILLEVYSASRYWSQIREHRATCTNLVAMQVRTILAQPPADTDRDHSIRCNFYAINVLDSEKEEFEARFGLRLMNGWGMSETMCAVTRTPLHGETRWPSVGIALHDRAIRIVDTAGIDVPIGEIGEIIVAGVPGISVMKGYFKDPVATAATLRNGWLHSGDNGYVDRDGYLYFYDRKKDMIKRAGENVSALEVESVIMGHPDVVEVAVIGVPDPIRDEAVKAFVVIRPGAEVSAEALKQHCRDRLSTFKVPTIIDFMDCLPKTSVGKVEKKQLRGERGAAS